MAYSDIYTAATTADSLLRKQIAVALHKSATDIAAEASNVANHAQRLAWARRVFADPTGWASKVVWTVMQNATIASTVPTTLDSDVQFVVNSNIDTFLTMV